MELKANDVCVKMLAAPINPSDINRIEGSSFIKSSSVGIYNESMSSIMQCKTVLSYQISPLHLVALFLSQEVWLPANMFSVSHDFFF